MNMLKFLLVIFILSLVNGCGKKNDQPTAEVNPVDTLSRIKKSGVLRWGADVVGGVPYVFEDPDNPGTYIGFEMDIAKAIAQDIGVEQELVIVAWDTLIPELQKKTFDFAMNGIEATEDRAKFVLYSVPYFVYAQQITVRKETEGIASLEDLKGKSVATLSGTAAEDILRAIPEIKVSINPEIIYSYKDLEDGKVDAVLLDTPIAAAYGAPNSKLKNVGEPFSEGTYVIAIRKDDSELRDAVNRALEKIKTNGTLKSIYEKWGIMNARQETLGVR